MATADQIYDLQITAETLQAEVDALKNESEYDKRRINELEEENDKRKAETDYLKMRLVEDGIIEFY